MKLIALLAIRNEELYIERCLQNLISQGFEVILIDNESTDNSARKASKYIGKGLQEIVNFKYSGHYEWEKILKLKEELFKETDADWFLHCDADEIHQPEKRFKNIKEALKVIDNQGYNAVNFDEFVFIPTKDSDEFTNADYVQEMRYYYYYSPERHHRLKLWKKTGSDIDLAKNGGHRVEFEEINIYPENFILRHYIFLSKEYAERKYHGRNFLSDEVDNKGWHGWRANFHQDMLQLPTPSELKFLSGNNFDTSDPKSSHPFIKNH